MSKSRPLRGLVEGLYLAVFLLVSCLKLRTLLHWGYTGDGFMYDHALSETLRGRFMLEYSFGCLFGEHAELFLAGVLLPLKLLLRERMIYLLVLLGPLSYLATGLYLLDLLVQEFGERPAVLASAGLALPPLLLSGLFENLWGFHTDILAGFLAAAMAGAFLAGRRTAGFAFALLFASLMEEFALLAAFFFLTVWTLDRKEAWFYAAWGFLAAYLAELWLIARFWTPFNRHVGWAAGVIISTMLSRPAATLLAVPAPFWAAAAFGLLLTAAMLRAWRRLEPPVAGLLVMAGLKAALSAFIGTLSIGDWHNLPVLVMASSALFLQSAAAPPRTRLAKRLPAAALAVLAALFALHDAPIAWSAWKGAADVRGLEEEVRTLRQGIDPSSVTAVDPPTALDWLGWRVSFFPRGAQWSPYGIADRIVARKGDPNLAAVPACYAREGGTEHFELLKRRAPCGRPLDESRAYFVRRFGPGSIGR